MSEFKYKDIDLEGWQTLDAIASAGRFNQWMYQTIRPYCNGKVLEIGSGIGNISRYFIESGSQITLSDIRPVYCNVLKQEFPGNVNVIQLDLVHPEFESEYAQQLGAYDAVFALNVVEHIENDALAIRNCYKLLKPNGKLVILVPAYQALYNRFDHELEHCRRYTKKKLNRLLEAERFKIIHARYFNFIGIAGWYVSGKLQRNKTIPKSQMSFYDKLVPFFKLIDKFVFNQVGLSAISVGQK